MGAKLISLFLNVCEFFILRLKTLSLLPFSVYPSTKAKAKTKAKEILNFQKDLQAKSRRSFARRGVPGSVRVLPRVYPLDNLMRSGNIVVRGHILGLNGYIGYPLVVLAALFCLLYLHMARSSSHDGSVRSNRLSPMSPLLPACGSMYRKPATNDPLVYVRTKAMHTAAERIF